jgi:hypothetical protein
MRISSALFAPGKAKRAFCAFCGNKPKTEFGIISKMYQRPSQKFVKSACA